LLVEKVDPFDVYFVERWKELFDVNIGVSVLEHEFYFLEKKIFTLTIFVFFVVRYRIFAFFIISFSIIDVVSEEDEITIRFLFDWTETFIVVFRKWFA
jgi:hypothetical protein